MTTPQPESATPAIIAAHAAELLLAEETAARHATAALRLRLAGIEGIFQKRWTELAPTTGQSSVDVIHLMADLAHELLHLPPIPTDRLVSAAQDAYRTGVRQAYLEVGLHPQPVALPIGDDLDAAAAAADAAAQDAAGRAALIAQATSRGTPATVRRIVSVARQGANSVERTARTLVNEQANTAIRDVAATAGARLLWVSERDACVVCLALSGDVVDAGETFNTAATFGSQPPQWVPSAGLSSPPRHFRCRCRVTPWVGDDRAPDSLPIVLRREAERSVLHGFALPSEPDSVRQEAAARLLTRIVGRHGIAPSGWKVPASVEKSTATRLRRGSFGVTPFPAHRP